MDLSEHEERFNIHPVGVRYICEFCNEGEQCIDPKGTVTQTDPPLYPHKCSKCGKTMQLPRPYPYIEWEKEEGN